MKKPTNDAVIEEIAIKTGGTRVYSQVGRNVVKLQSSRTLMYLDYHSSRELPYTIDISFLGLRSSHSYLTMEEQIKVAKNISKICMNIVKTVYSTMEKSLKGKTR
jgi:hypothetical protein